MLKLIANDAISGLDFTSSQAISTNTPSSTVATMCQLHVTLAALDGTGGFFEVTISIGGVMLQPTPTPIDFAATATAAFDVGPFTVPANKAVVISLKSPNAGDSADVTGNAYLYDVSATDIVSISGDSGAADNLESMYDGTGYVHDSAPASRDQIAALSGGVTISATAGSREFLSTGDTDDETLTYAVTASHDGAFYEVADSGAGVGIDFYLEFDIGEGAPVDFHIDCHYEEGGAPFNNNSLAIRAYNWNTTTYETVETLEHNTSVEVHDIGLNVTHANTAGKVRNAFTQASQEAS